jgi:hypothetical protein
LEETLYQTVSSIREHIWGNIQSHVQS